MPSTGRCSSAQTTTGASSPTSQPSGLVGTGTPFTLILTGPAGGSHGHGGPDLALDAVEFCRTLSGRETGAGLLAQPVPF